MPFLHSQHVVITHNANDGNHGLTSLLVSSLLSSYLLRHVHQRCPAAIGGMWCTVEIMLMLHANCKWSIIGERKHVAAGLGLCVVLGVAIKRGPLAKLNPATLCNNTGCPHGGNRVLLFAISHICLDSPVSVTHNKTISSVQYSHGSVKGNPKPERTGAKQYFMCLNKKENGFDFNTLKKPILTTAE